MWIECALSWEITPYSSVFWESGHCVKMMSLCSSTSDVARTTLMSETHCFCVFKSRTCSSKGKIFFFKLLEADGPLLHGIISST